ncbi:putative entry exclusion protein TrbK-alt [Rhizobium pusense]|uniref:putative entry exclusion protein TrbK-alt n=1 Tax=Agrobacterium pusense TaxID=648995 RepID=UPI002449865C|nr:putative entry exclusion protein TrbK-alt [Agrobacterium pusense]MDH1270490.1 putative entry exclusion protein TrbK-alt [Agrobacterium pusense]
MDLKIAARMLAVLTIGAGLTAAITAMHDNGDQPEADAPRIKRPGGEPDPRPELARCRALGVAALEEASCRDAWAGSRRRFLETDKPARPKPERSGEPGTGKEQDRLLPDPADGTGEGQTHG